MTANDFMPEPIRRRLGLSASDEQLEAIKRRGFELLQEYAALVLKASCGMSVDPDELHAAAAAVGRPPHRVQVDLEISQAAYLAWQSSVSPV